MEQIIVNGIYKHYKGNLYQVIALGKDSETLHDVVIYKSIDDGKVWVRPVSMWFEQINKSTVRFTYLDGCLI